MEFLEFIAKYLLLPLATLISTVGWRMYKKLDDRLDHLEKRTNDAEKGLIEVRTEIRKDIQYMAEDIKDIKELLKSGR